MRQLKKLVEEEMDLIYIEQGPFDSKGHPTHFILFPTICGKGEIKRVASAGSPKSRKRALFNFRTKLNKIMDGRIRRKLLTNCYRCDGEKEEIDFNHLCQPCEELLMQYVEE